MPYLKNLCMRTYLDFQNSDNEYASKMFAISDHIMEYHYAGS